MLAAVVTLAVGVAAWQRRDAPGGRALLCLMLSVMFWSVCDICKLLWPTQAPIYFFTQIEQIGVVGVPAFWLLFALDYTGEGHWLTRRNLLVLACLEGAIVLVSLTNPAHSGMWTKLSLDQGGPYPVLTGGRGPWWWVNIAVNYPLIVAGTVAMAWHLRQAREPYR